MRDVQNLCNLHGIGIQLSFLIEIGIFLGRGSKFGSWSRKKNIEQHSPIPIIELIQHEFAFCQDALLLYFTISPKGVYIWVIMMEIGSRQHILWPPQEQKKKAWLIVDPMRCCLFYHIGYVLVRQVVNFDKTCDKLLTESRVFYWAIPKKPLL